MKKSTFDEYLEKKIYKILEELKACENIGIAEFLGKLVFDIHIEKKELKFSHTSLFKFLLFMKLKKLKQTETVRYLKKHEQDALSLGFYYNENNELVVPDQRTISHFYNHVMDDELRNLVNTITKSVRETAEKFGLIIDIDLSREKPKTVPAASTFFKKRNERLMEVSKLAKKHIYPEIKLKTGHNCIYKKSFFMSLMTYLSKQNDFAHGGLRIYETEKETKTPDSDTLLYHIKKFDIEELQRIFEKAFEKIWKIAKSSEIFNKRKYDVSIDYTDWMYYGKPSDMVVKGKEKNGTNKSYRFATISIVENGCRFVLLALPVNAFYPRERIVEKLIAYAKSKININRIYADRGFFSSNMINLFKKHGLKFLMPATQNSRIKKMLKSMPAPSIINSYEMSDGKVSYNLVIVEDENFEKRAFATSLDVTESEANLSTRLFGLYSKRWGIETSYRVLKTLRAKTTSKNYKIRLFYFLFSILLYNMWIMVDAVLVRTLKGRLENRHLIEGKMFLSKFMAILDEGVT